MWGLSKQETKRLFECQREYNRRKVGSMINFEFVRFLVNQVNEAIYDLQNHGIKAEKISKIMIDDVLYEIFPDGDIQRPKKE